MDKYIKTLINILCQTAGYKVLEISNPDGLISSWAACRISESSAEVVVFSDSNNINSLNTFLLEESLKTELSCSFVFVKLVLLDEKGDSQNEFTASEPMALISQLGIAANAIVLEPSSGRILYYGNAAAQIANELAAGLNSLIKQQSFEKRPIPILTYILIAINVLAFLLTAILSGNFINSDINVLVFLGAKVNSLISAGEYYRLITCMFLHGGIVHLGLNMYALYVLGPLVEQIYGKARFLIIYFIAGILGSYFSFLFSSGISIGASGAIFGLLGAALIFALKMKDRIGRGFMINIVTVIIINLVIGFSISNVDNFGHLGGLTGGAIVSYLLFLKSGSFK
jgi:rhomboid protease GluP